MAQVSHVVADGGTVSRWETVRYTKDGRILNISLSASRFSDHHGNPAGMVVILRDVSEKKAAERRFGI